MSDSSTKKANTIILCGGSSSFFNYTFNPNQNHAMIPVNGKPVIGWILEELVEKYKTQQVTVVMRLEDTSFKQFLDRAYGGKFRIKSVSTAGSSILGSLLSGLQHIDTSVPTRVVLGDTLLRDKADESADMIFSHSVAESSRWCLVKTDANNHAVAYFDKQNEVEVDEYLAVCGHYYFQDSKWLLEATQQCIKEQQGQMSNLLTHYGTKRKITVQKATQWYDFGNLDTLVESKQKLLSGRYFNSLTVDPVLNIITKVSEFNEKLKDEIAWYDLLPEPLKVLTPRIVSCTTEGSKVRVSQEYYGYPTVSELFLYSGLDATVWRLIFSKIFNIHSSFRKYTVPVDENGIRTMYGEKTWQRLEVLGQEKYWANLMRDEYIFYNGYKLFNIYTLKERIDGYVEKLSKNAEFAVLHGDLCFSNILFDVGSQICRLIDPRGSFGEKGVYGDVRYDLAKLRHSAVGYYDYIIADMFSLSELSANTFVALVHHDPHAPVISALFDQFVVKYGFDLEEIQFIEGLLFISMVPFHRDKPMRQRMMYLRGLILLNQILKGIKI